MAGRDENRRLLDPRTKVLGFAGLSILPFVFNDPRFVSVVAVAFLCVGIWAGCLGAYARSLRLIAALPLTAFVSWQLFGPRHVLFAEIGPITLAQPAVDHGATAAARLLAVIALGLMFATAISPDEVVAALVALRLPHVVAFSIGLTLRLVPLMALLLGTVLEAQVARGLEPGGRNPVRSVRQIVAVVIPVVVLAARYANSLGIALESRGFRPGAPRTNWVSLTAAPRDHVTLAFVVTTLLVSFVLRLGGYGSL